MKSYTFVFVRAWIQKNLCFEQHVAEQLLKNQLATQAQYLFTEANRKSTLLRT